MAKPTTLDECMQELSLMMAADPESSIAKMSKDDLAMTHHGLGQWIRNNWDLWKGGPLLEHMKSLGFRHADDMSSAIITEFWNRTNNQPSEIAEQVKEYNEFWDALHEAGKKK